MSDIGQKKLLALAEIDPEAALALLKTLQSKTVIPHSGGQQEIYEDKSQFKIVCCGRRFGKTLLGGKMALQKCREPNRMVWWVAPTYKVVKRGYREVLRQLPKDVLTHEPPQDSAFDAGRSVILRFKNGSRIEFYSAERPEGMLGEAVDFVIMDEAAIMGKSVWEQTIRPTLIDREGQALMISTPRGRNWFYYEWLRGQDDKKPKYKSWRFPSASNPFLPPGEIEELRESMPLVVFQQEVLAEFISSAGAVFRFNVSCIVKTHKPEGDVFVGIDLAKSQDFTVVSAARGKDMQPCGFMRFNDVAWTIQRNRIKTFVKWLYDNGAENVTLVMDATGVGDPIVENMEEDGYDVIPINFTKTKAHMVIQLTKDLEDGYVKLDEKEDISEFENYTYKTTESGKMTYGAPEGQHDDCVSAKMLQHWGIVQEGRPNVVAVSPADDEDNLPEALAVDEHGDPILGATENYEYLLDDDFADSPGEPGEVFLIPDSPDEIMARGWAWNAVEV